MREWKNRRSLHCLAFARGSATLTRSVYTTLDLEDSCTRASTTTTTRRFRVRFEYLGLHRVGFSLCSSIEAHLHFSLHQLVEHLGRE